MIVSVLVMAQQTTHTVDGNLQIKIGNTNETTVARNKIDMMILAAALDSPYVESFTAACEGEVTRTPKKKKKKEEVEFVDLHLVV